jgi:hypothetical protein
MAMFPSIRIEGGLLGPDLIDQLLTGDLPGQKPTDFGLKAQRNLTDEIAALFADARSQWSIFQHRLERLKPDDLATSVTRDAWVIPLLGLLGYEPKYNSAAFDVDGMSFAISHCAGEPAESPPLHIVGYRQELGRVPASGRPRMAPHSLLQEYLNRTEHLWGIVTNGSTLRLLRDCTFVRRQAYIEFDLAGMFDEQRFADFAALYRLLHRSRLPQGTTDTADCLLERYYATSIEQGGRVRDGLRDGVQQSLERLAEGFLHHKNNGELRRRIALSEGQHRLSAEELYRQLLRLVYRFLFLLVSEDRGLLSAVPIYRQHYGVARLRNMVERRAAHTEHGDIWQSLRVLWFLFGHDEAQLDGKPLAAALGLPVLNGDLFASQDLDDCAISNRDLLGAFWHLAWYQESGTAPPRRVNYAALDVEELGSVYESLLEFHPAIDRGDAARPKFQLVAGSERKSTGSYYTPPELVAELIRSALDPVIRDRLEKNPKAKEQALLGIRVCDPACGSGHFLLAAARRIGKELARVRTGEDEPPPERAREAIRDAIAHCIYGVDKNPLAVDLCRVALWLEGHTADKPLTFLNHRIRPGDSLVGVFNLDCLKDGIPDKAFESPKGGDKAEARRVMKQNREERDEKKRGLFDALPESNLGEFTEHSREVDEIANDSPVQIRKKRELYDRSHADPQWRRQKLACDLWCAAFFQPLTADAPAITSADLADCLADRAVAPAVERLIESIANRQRFFHWPLEYPEAFVSGGFDVLLSNPPWEMINLIEQEFFASRDPQIAAAKGAARKKLIAALPESNPAVFAEFSSASHEADCFGKYIRHGERFPLTAVGRINTYAVFAETIRHLISPSGRAGIIVPTGIATDDTTKAFFSDLIQRESLAQLLGFENESFIFPAVANVVRFCTLTIAGESGREPNPKFVFYLRLFSQLAQKERYFQLTSEDILLLNPNTRTCPVFRTEYDAELTRKIYRTVPVLVREDKPDGNPWGVRFAQGLFNMASDSRLFEKKPGKGLLPLYEGKLFWHFDHRFASYENKGLVQGKGGRGLPDTPLEKSQDPSWCITPQYWVAAPEVDEQLESLTTNGWLLAFRDVTSSKLERSAVFSFLPRVAVGHKAPLIFIAERFGVTLELCLMANFNSLVFDYAVRQKLGGTSLSFFVMKQLPVLPPSFYQPADVTYVGARVLELVYTANDMKPLADALRASESPLAKTVPDEPYRWDEPRRALLRSELDAWFARAYGLTRDELRYILDPADVRGQDFPGETFRVLKEKETDKFREFRTRRLVLEAWDRLA